MYKYPKYQQKNKKYNKTILSAILFIFIVSLSTSFYFYLKQNLRVKEIVFVGNQHLDKDDLQNLLKVKENDLLLNISAKQMYKNLKESPWIKDARIRKELSGRILIQIYETAPSAVLIRAKKPYFIDSSGTILEEIEDPSVIFLPVIMEIDPFKNKETYKEAIALLNLINDKKTFSHAGHIEITGLTPDELIIKVDELLIKIGVGDYEKKIERLERIKEEIKNIAIEYIDLRFSEQVIVKPMKLKQ